MTKQKKITRKEMLFVDGLLQGKTQDKAFIEAGYKAKNNDSARTLASALLTKHHIAQYYGNQKELFRAKIEEKTEATVLKTVSELARIGYCDPANIFDAAGNLREIPDMDENTRRAISSIEVKIEKGSDGKKFAEVAKIRFWSKPDALKTLATYLGILIEKHEYSGNVTTNKRIDVSTLSMDDIAQLSNMMKRIKFVDQEVVEKAR